MLVSVPIHPSNSSRIRGVFDYVVGKPHKFKGFCVLVFLCNETTPVQSSLLAQEKLPMSTTLNALVCFQLLYLEIYCHWLRHHRFNTPMARRVGADDGFTTLCTHTPTSWTTTRPCKMWGSTWIITLCLGLCAWKDNLKHGQAIAVCNKNSWSLQHLLMCVHASHKMSKWKFELYNAGS